jgi:hypothetical protein
MPETSDWKKTMRESNALGWLAFFGLVVAIGVGTIIFGSAPDQKAANAPLAAGTDTNSTGPKYLK